MTTKEEIIVYTLGWAVIFSIILVVSMVKGK